MQDPPVLAVIPGFLVSKFQFDLNHFRDRRFLYFPAQTSLKSLEISNWQNQAHRIDSDGRAAYADMPEQTAQSETTTLYLQNTAKQEGESTVVEWTRLQSNGDAVQVDQGAATRLESTLKQIQSLHFGDELTLTANGYPTPERQKVIQNGVKLDASLSDGTRNRAWLYQPDKTIALDQKSYVWLATDNDEFVNLTSKDQWAEILRSTRAILNGIPSDPSHAQSSRPLREADQHDHNH